MTTKITVSMVLLTTALLVPLSTTITILYAGFVLFVTFVCPYWLLWMQRYKKYACVFFVNVAKENGIVVKSMALGMKQRYR